MNQFHVVVNKLKEMFQDNPNVNTVVFGLNEDRDLYKKSIYPLVQINPIAAPWDSSSNTSRFQFEIAALDQRDISKSVASDKFDGNDDLQDNLNITYTILNDIVTRFNRLNMDNNIEMEDVSQAQPILFKDYNLLDGWMMAITLSIPNEQFIC